MVMKKKTGKGRLDKYYYLAKEQGYRARSAFKLVQLNSKYKFLESARVLVDLCAAPGGWLQVASKYMPMSHVIIGIDLDPIKPIPGIKTFVCDITTDKCRSVLKTELKTWKADIFLNDGAPNVGTSWSKDAYNQSELALAALKLSCEFLIEGGIFVTKIFRSKDYNSLLWVFGQLFDKVEATKPVSSRNVSAEIYVVCKGFLAPKKTDPRLFDPKHIFQEIDDKNNHKSIDIFHPEKHHRQRQGYDDDVMILFKKESIHSFVICENPLVFMSNYNEISFDGMHADRYLNSKATTEEIKDYFKDLKVLGKREFKILLKWRLKMRDSFSIIEQSIPNIKYENTIEEKKIVSNSEEDFSEEEGKMKELLREHEKAKVKLKRKRLEKKKKERIRMQFGMSINGDKYDINEDTDLFKIDKIKKTINVETEDEAKEIALILEDSYHTSTIDMIENDTYQNDNKEDDLSDEFEGERITKLERDLEASYNVYKDKMSIKRKHISINKEKTLNNDLESFDLDAINMEKKDISDDDNDESTNYLLSFDKEKNNWYANPLFSHIASDSESNEDDEKIPSAILNSGEQNSNIQLIKADDQIDSSDDENNTLKLNTISSISRALKLRDSSKEDLIDESFNRYSGYDLTGLPEWFTDNERQHNVPQMPITKEAVALLKEKLKSLNARPIKKVLEAQAKKKMRLVKKIDNLKKKAAIIADSEEMTEKQKLSTITKMISKKTMIKRNKPKMIVARHSNRGIKGRPRGVKGRYKMVDPRMKKELRAAKIIAKSNNHSKKFNKK